MEIEVQQFETAWAEWCARSRAKAAASDNAAEKMAIELIIAMKRPLIDWMRVNRTLPAKDREEIVLNICGQIAAETLMNTRGDQHPLELIPAITFVGQCCMKNLIAMRTGVVSVVGARLLDS